MGKKEDNKATKHIVNNFQGATIHNFVYNDHGTTNIYGREAGKQEGYTDEQVATALANIVGNGKPIDSKLKWAGALWLLRWECNYPAKAQDFCERIKALPLPELEYPCDYNNIRQQSTLSFLNQDPRQMETVRYSPNDEKVFFQLKEVALALREELRKN